MGEPSPQPSVDTTKMSTHDKVVLLLTLLAVGLVLAAIPFMEDDIPTPKATDRIAVTPLN